MAIGAAHVGMLGRRAEALPKPGAEGASASLAEALAEAGSRELTAIGRATEWLNSPRLAPEALSGKVVLVQFCTYTCINWLRTLPYVRAWEQRYRQQLVVIGVHAPEFAFERDIGNVKKAVHDLGIDFPVAIDNRFTIWRAFSNEYWPAHYFVDAQGRVRRHHFGEGEYAESERAIQSLLAEAGHPEALNVPIGLAGAPAKGALAAADNADVRSPETYVGYARAEDFMSPGGVVRDAAYRYAEPAGPDLNDWGLAGTWQVGAERVVRLQRGRLVLYGVGAEGCCGHVQERVGGTAYFVSRPTSRPQQCTEASHSSSLLRNNLPPTTLAACVPRGSSSRACRRSRTRVVASSRSAN